MKRTIPFKQVTAVAAALATAGLLPVGATASTAAASSSTDTGIQPGSTERYSVSVVL
jgi:hypothetical protein